MANVMLVNPFPAGFDSTQTALTVNGSVALVGSAVTTGEPINWNLLNDGVGYNEVNFRGNGVNGPDTAQTTGFAISAGVCTCTAANNFSAGQQVTFLGNTQTLSALFNKVVITVISATSSAFTFATASTGTTTTGDVGIAYTYAPRTIPEPGLGAIQNLTVTALSASGTTLTVTAANNLLPGAIVNIVVATGTLGPKLAGLQLPVIFSTSTAFTATMPSALTGTTGTGTGTGVNGPQPYSVKFWSEIASGYIYQYDSTTGCLFVYQGGAGTPAGTIVSTSTAPTITTSSGGVTTALGVAAGALSEVAGASGITGVQAPTITSTFTGSAGSAGALTPLSAAAYPAGVLADVIKMEAKFCKG